MKKLLKTVLENLSENMADQCTTHTLDNKYPPRLVGYYQVYIGGIASWFCLEVNPSEKGHTAVIE